MTPTVTSVYPEMIQNYTVNEGNSVIFECSATGIPAPVITWLRNGRELNSATDSRVTIRNASAPISFIRGDSETVLEVSRTLTLDNTVDSDSGLYECRATNVAGTNADSFEVIVNVQSTLESFEV